MLKLLLSTWTGTGWNPSYNSTELEPSPLLSTSEVESSLDQPAALLVRPNYLPSLRRPSLEAPVYTDFSSIYPGPHIDLDGDIDPRIWFYVRMYMDTESGTTTYLIFPYGGTEEEMTELTVDV